MSGKWLCRMLRMIRLGAVASPSLELDVDRNIGDPRCGQAVELLNSEGSTTER